MAHLPAGLSTQNDTRYTVNYLTQCQVQVVKIKLNKTKTEGHVTLAMPLFQALTILKLLAFKA